MASADDPGHPLGRVERIAGRRLQVNLAPFAATEGDVWLYDPASRLLVAGDLVVTEVPFMDTACAEGWRRALDAIAATPFTTLIPGHGDPMTHEQFLFLAHRVRQSPRLRRLGSPTCRLHRRLAPRRRDLHAPGARAHDR